MGVASGINWQTPAPTELGLSQVLSQSSGFVRAPLGSCPETPGSRNDPHAVKQAHPRPHSQIGRRGLCLRQSRPLWRKGRCGRVGKFIFSSSVRAQVQNASAGAEQIYLPYCKAINFMHTKNEFAVFHQLGVIASYRAMAPAHLLESLRAHQGTTHHRENPGAMAPKEVSS